MSETVNITVGIEVPDSHIETLIEMAGYGIAYWAESATLNKELRTYSVLLDAEGGEDPDLPRHRYLKYEWIAKRLIQFGTGTEFEGTNQKSAVAGYARDYVRDMLNPEEREYADGIIDAELADVIIQLCYFDGKVIFG